MYSLFSDKFYQKKNDFMVLGLHLDHPQALELRFNKLFSIRILLW